MTILFDVDFPCYYLFYIFNEAYLQELHNYIMCISYLIFQNLIFVF